MLQDGEIIKVSRGRYAHAKPCRPHKFGGDHNKR